MVCVSLWCPGVERGWGGVSEKLAGKSASGAESVHSQVAAARVISLLLPMANNVTEYHNISEPYTVRTSTCSERS